MVQKDVLPRFLSYYYLLFTGYGFWAVVDKSTGEFLDWFHLRPDRTAIRMNPSLATGCASRCGAFPSAAFGLADLEQVSVGVTQDPRMGAQYRNPISHARCRRAGVVLRS